MTDSYTQVPPDSTGDKIDTEQLTVNAQTVERQRIQIAGTTDTAIAPVTLADGLLVNLGTNNDVTVTSISAGDNNIGNVDVVTLPALAAGTNNIGDVDVLSVIPGTGATDLGKAVDAVAGASDTGVAPVAIRDNALSTLTPAEGDYVQLRVDGNGALWVIPSGTTTVDNGGTFAVQVDAALPAGTNNIGDVDIASALPAGTNNIGDVDVASIADSSGANLIGSVAVSGTHMYDDMAGGQAVAQVKFASVDTATSGDNTIVAAVTGKSIQVLSYVLVASGGANTLTWKSATAGAVTGGMGIADTGGISANSMTGLFNTTAGEALVLNLSAATSVDGHISYIEVD